MKSKKCVPLNALLSSIINNIFFSKHICWRSIKHVYMYFSVYNSENNKIILVVICKMYAENLYLNTILNFQLIKDKMIIFHIMS